MTNDDAQRIIDFINATKRLTWMEAESTRNARVILKVGAIANYVTCDTLKEAEDFTTIVENAPYVAKLLEVVQEVEEDIEQIPEQFENGVHKMTVEVPVVDGVVQCVEVNGKVVDGALAELFLNLFSGVK